MHDLQARLDKIISKLREKQFRITPQRIAIIRAFLENPRHPGVDQVYRQVRGNFPTTSLATVYKTVNLLKEIGEILEVGLADGRNHYDGIKPYPHPHLICTRCKTILDPDVRMLEQLTSEVADTSGFRIDSHQIDFFGVCPLCQKK